jgi:prophage tail gpP-like protein
MSADGRMALIIDGVEMRGWTQALVSRAITQACSAFQVSLNDSDDLRIRANPGDACTVAFGGETLITGHIDAVEINYSATSHDIAISGRSRTADLVDSWLDPLQYLGLGAVEVIRRIATQFGVGVEVIGDASGLTLGGAGEEFAVQSRDGLAFDAIQDAAGRAGWYLSDTPTGNLVLSRTAGLTTKNEIIVMPGAQVNVLGASYRDDQSSRFNTYRVIGQQASTDQRFGRDTAQILGEVTDRDIGRNRLKVITAETGLTTVQAEARAIQERQAAIAASFGIEYVVQGWTGSGNELWRENRLVNVRDDILGVRRQLLIDTVNYIQDVEGGTTCRLSLVLPEARLPATVSTAGVATIPADMGYPQ